MTSLTVIGIPDGSIEGCAACSRICGYGCCTQSRPGDPEFGPETSILLYPGEWEAVAEDTRAHLLITLQEYHGGKLAYCDKEHFDQSRCHPENNFKPLDCASYPFAPAIRDGQLVLLKDPRCPLPIEALQNHYAHILRRWQEVLERQPEVAEWISCLSVDGYIPYESRMEEIQAKQV